VQAQPLILTVERNLRNLELLNKFLTDKGFRTVSAGNIEELDQKLLETEPIALALVDLAGFDKGIWERCNQLRQSGIPFLVISPQTSAGTQRAGLAHGASGVLVKPLIVKELVAIIQNLMRT
jgi:DNA-binding response OmpR family regulator